MAKKILLVEDNAQNRVLATFLLEEAGMEVIPAVTGAEGLQMARDRQPDLILLDIQLPDIDGYELLRLLKADPSVGRIPVVAVTSYAMAGERKRALELGCAGYVEKPIDTANFAGQITRYLKKETRKLNILVVEDRPESALLLKDILETEGYAVVTSANGREALTRAGEQKFDLLITDLLMPEMDGYQLTYNLKSDPELKDIPVLVYSATYTESSDKALAMELGAAEFLVKPAETATLVAVIRDIVARNERGELRNAPAPRTSETAYLRQYTERLVRKLEDKVVEAEEANRKLETLNSELEQRVASATTELRNTITQLNAVNKELESFAYTVAHDLRAPLRTVRGFVSVLREMLGPQLPPEAQSICQRLTHNAELMDQLIEDLLKYSRLGTATLTLTPLSLNAVVAQACSLLSGAIQQSHAQVAIQPDMPAVIAHESTLVQVVANLIGNGIKFVKPGVQPKVELGAIRTEQRVRFYVKDNGIGIEEQYQERIFNVFERLHDNETYPGTGVGLALVRKGVEKMGGQAGVESNPGEGSRFWIDLPSANQLLRESKEG